MASPEVIFREKEEGPLPVSESELVHGLERPFATRGVGEAFERLVLRMKDKLADYDVIISDEASARLVTLTLQDVINKKRKEAGKAFAPKICIAGGEGRRNQQEIEDVLQKKIVGEKALLVTEIIGSGDSIARLAEILDRFHINFDIATLSSAGNPKRDLYWPDLLKDVVARNGLYYGQMGLAGNNFFNQEHVSGVVKDRYSNSPFPRKFLGANKERVIRSHKDSAILADRLYEIIKEDTTQ